MSPTAPLSPGARLAAMRAAAPLVHNITNYVAMNVMANVLLAAGASIDAPDAAGLSPRR